MATPGRRAKSRTHATAPFYERERRANALILARVEKRVEKQARRRGRPSPLADHLSLFLAARQALRKDLVILFNWPEDR